MLVVKGVKSHVCADGWDDSKNQLVCSFIRNTSVGVFGGSEEVFGGIFGRFKKGFLGGLEGVFWVV